MTKGITNKQLKRIKDLLKEKKIRHTEGTFVLEGYKVIMDALNKGYSFDLILVSDKFISEEENRLYIEGLEKKGIEVSRSEDDKFKAVSSLQNPEGILGIVWMKKEKTIDKFLLRNKSSVIVLCDNIQDPGNLGTIIRTSLAFGVNSIFLYGDNVDVYNPKVIRATSGAILDVNFYIGDINDVNKIRRKGFCIVSSVLDKKESKNIDKLKIPSKNRVLVFGNEGKGVSRAILAVTDSFYYIPISRNIESLNVSVAAGISLYEFCRR